MDVKTNLITGQFTTTKFGLTFLYVTVVSLGLSIVAAGAIAIIGLNERQAIRESAATAFRAASISAATSNENANPGIIAFYLNDTFAGAITENGEYSPAADAPPEGPLAVHFANPTTATLPTTVEFMPQTIALTTNAGTIKVCVPRITGDKTIWVNKDGDTFSNAVLTERARSC